MNAIVVIGGSAGGLDPLRKIIAELTADSRASIFIVVHIGANRSVLPDLLARAGALPAVFGKNGALIEQGRIYVAPPDHHMLLERRHIRLNQDAKIHFTRPAVDPLFRSAAKAFGDRVVGIILSGGDGDGAEGLRAIAERGGITLVQDPEEAMTPSMPYSAMMSTHPNGCLSTALLARRVRELCR